MIVIWFLIWHISYQVEINNIWGGSQSVQTKEAFGGGYFEVNLGLGQ